MADDKVVKLAAAGGDLAKENEPPPPTNEELLVALNQLPVHVPSTPALRAALERLFRFSHARWQDRDIIAVGETTTPKRSGLTALNTEAQRLRRALERMPKAQQWGGLIGAAIHASAQDRSQEVTSIVARMDYEDIAKMFEPPNGQRIDLLIECLADGIATVCEMPVPVTRKQAAIALRADCIRGLAKAFRRHTTPLSSNQLVTVARALAPFFPPEAGLEEITVRTVQRLMRQKTAG